MSENESQFILAAYRPNGLDDDDPAMTEALETLQGDSERRASFEAQVRFDRSVAAALATVPAPSGLRDSILAGARFSAGPKSETAAPAGPVRAGGSAARGWTGRLAAAAAVVVLAGLALWLAGRGDSPAPEVPGGVAASGEAWKQGSLALLDSVAAGSTGFDLIGADPAQTRAWLRREFGRDIALPTTLAALPSVGCKCVESADGRIALVCLDAGGGTIVHLTVYEGPDEPPASLAVRPSDAAVERSGRWAFAAWRDERSRYLLVSADEPPARQRVRELLGIGET